MARAATATNNATVFMFPSCSWVTKSKNASFLPLCLSSRFVLCLQGTKPNLRLEWWLWTARPVNENCFRVPTDMPDIYTVAPRTTCVACVWGLPTEPESMEIKDSCELWNHDDNVEAALDIKASNIGPGGSVAKNSARELWLHWTKTNSLQGLRKRRKKTTPTTLYLISVQQFCCSSTASAGASRTTQASFVGYASRRARLH